MEVLQNYIRLERPLTSSPYLFVSLKGRRRGQPLTTAGLRSLFRHHRLRSEVPVANPDRFRHTFGADMVRAVVSLLKRWLMGTRQDAVSHKHLEYYLDEFTFRFNRRRSASRGKIFYRLVQQAVAAEPSTYDEIVGRIPGRLKTAGPQALVAT